MALVIRVANNEAEGLDADGGKWSVVCVTHGTLLSVDTRTQAREEARAARAAGWAEWCEECCELPADHHDRKAGRA